MSGPACKRAASSGQSRRVYCLRTGAGGPPPRHRSPCRGRRRKPIAAADRRAAALPGRRDRRSTGRPICPPPACRSRPRDPARRRRRGLRLRGRQAGAAAGCMAVRRASSRPTGPGPRRWCRRRCRARVAGARQRRNRRQSGAAHRGRMRGRARRRCRCAAPDRGPRAERLHVRGIERRRQQPQMPQPLDRAHAVAPRAIRRFRAVDSCSVQHDAGIQFIGQRREARKRRVAHLGWPRAARSSVEIRRMALVLIAQPQRPASSTRRHSSPRDSDVSATGMPITARMPCSSRQARDFAREITAIAETGDSGLEHFGDRRQQAPSRRNRRRPRARSRGCRPRAQQRARHRCTLIMPGINRCVGSLEQHAADVALGRLGVGQDVEDSPVAHHQGMILEHRLRAVMGTSQRASMRKSARALRACPRVYRLMRCGRLKTAGICARIPPC